MRNTIVVRAMKTIVITLLAISALGIPLVIQMFNIEWDLSQTRRHSLSPSTQSILRSLPEPLTIKVLLTRQQKSKLNRTVLLKLINQFSTRAKVHKSNIAVKVIYHDGDAELVRRYRIKATDEVVVEYRERHVKIHSWDEQAIGQALLQVSQQQDYYIAFVEGHGERSPFDKGAQGMSVLAGMLAKRNFRVISVNLAITDQIPDNTAILVIASPKMKFQANELSTLLRYLARGGNLLWLQDPGRDAGLDLLASKFGVEFLPGAVHENNLGKYKASVLVTNQFKTGHSLSHGLGNFNVFFPQARGIRVTAANPYRHDVLIHSSVNSVSVRQPADSNQSTQANDSVKGPHPVVVALQKQIKKQHAQRVVLIGDSDFLSNRYISLGINNVLGLNTFNWLNRQESLNSIARPALADYHLNFNSMQMAALGAGFALLLPLLILIAFWKHHRSRVMQDKFDL